MIFADKINFISARRLQLVFHERPMVRLSQTASSKFISCFCITISSSRIKIKTLDYLQTYLAHIVESTPLKMVFCNLEFSSDFVRKIVPNLHIQHGCCGAGTERQEEQKRTNCSSHQNATTKYVLNLILKTLYIVSCSDGIRTSRNAAKCVVPEVTDMILNTERAVHQIQREEFAHETFCSSEIEI